MHGVTRRLFAYLRALLINELPIVFTLSVLKPRVLRVKKIVNTGIPDLFPNSQLIIFLVSGPDSYVAIPVK